MSCHKYTLLGTLVILTIAGCTEENKSTEEPAVTAVYDHTADFSNYHTFALVDPDEAPAGALAPDSLTEANRIAINDAITNEMEKRGYTRDQTNPDLRMTYFVRLRDIQVTTQGAYWYNYYYGWYWGYGYPWYYTDVSTLDAGSLIIDAVAIGNPSDSSDDILVFRGTATDLLPDQPTDMSKKIPGVVEEIFSYWPEEKPQ